MSNRSLTRKLKVLYSMLYVVVNVVYDDGDDEYCSCYYLIDYKCVQSMCDVGQSFVITHDPFELCLTAMLFFFVRRSAHINKWS